MLAAARRVSLFAAMLLTLVVSGVAGAKELPQGDAVRTWRDHFKPQEIAFYQRTLIEPYREQHSYDDETRTLCDAFLERWLDSATAGYVRTDFKPAVKAGEEAARAGCKDPLFHFLYGQALWRDRQFNAAIKQLSLADQQWSSTNYHPYFAFQIQVALIDSLYRANQAAAADARRSSHHDMAVQAFLEHPYTADESWLHYYHMLGYFDASKEHEVIDTLSKVLSNEGLSPWLKQLLAGSHQVDLAWEARGDGWAHTVTDEGWELFAEHMGRAREHLRAAWEIDPDVPFAANKMIVVARCGMDGESLPRDWFDRTVATMFDFLPAYDLLRTSLMPRWGGSHEQLMDLGIECVNTGHFDTAVPMQYYYSLARISSDLGQSYEPYKQPAVYGRLIRLADGYLAEPTVQFDRRWFQTFKVGMAYRAEKWDDAATFLDEIEGPLDPAALQRINLNGTQVVGEVRGRSREFAEQHRQVDQLLAVANYEAAIPLVQAMIAQASSQADTEAYLRELLRLTEFKAKYEAGEWVNILPNKRLDGWKKNVGKWNASNQGELLGAAEVNGLLLVCRYDLGTHFELRGKTSFIKSPYAKEFNVGIWFGTRSSQMNDSFRFYRGEKYAAIYGDGEVTKREVGVERDNSFLLRRQGEVLSATFNDQEIMTDVYIHDEINPENQTIAIGGFYWYAGPIIRFDSLEVRKLDPLAPGDGEIAERTASAP